MFLLVEEAVLKKMIEFIGWNEGDGIFNPGKKTFHLQASKLIYRSCRKLVIKYLVSNSLMPNIFESHMIWAFNKAISSRFILYVSRPY